MNRFSFKQQIYYEHTIRVQDYLKSIYQLLLCVKEN